MTSHHNHDEDLVMALAEGPLAVDSAEVRARLGGCPECLEDLRLHRRALAALGVAPQVGLNDLESARLHRRLDLALDHQRLEPAPAVSTRRRRRIAWAPLASAAAVLLALVLVAPTLSLLGGGDDSSDQTAVAMLEEDTEESEAPMEMEDAADGGEPAAGAEEMPFDDMADADMDDGGLTTTAATDDTLVMDEEAAERPAPIGSLDELWEIVVTTDDVDTARRAAGAVTLDGAVAAAACIVEGAEVVEAPVESDTLGFVELDVEGRVLVTVHRAEPDLTVVVAHDPDTCTVLDFTS